MDLRSELLVVLVAPIPALIAFLTFGAIETPDSAGYISYAEQLRAGTLPSGVALLKEAPAPVSMQGHPSFLHSLSKSCQRMSWWATTHSSFSDRTAGK